MNRRFATRIPLKSEAKIVVGDAQPRAALTLDISLSGVGILVPFPVAVGSSLYLQTELPGLPRYNSFEAECRVITSQSLRQNNSSVLGMEFVSIRGDFDRALNAFMHLY